MRISDWSSDVCSSDLLAAFVFIAALAPAHAQTGAAASQQPTLAIRAARLIAPEHGKVIAHPLVLIEGERIVSVQSGGTAPAGVPLPIGRASCRERVCQYV